jgi:ABC-2 type transport system ATP-binding protein
MTPATAPRRGARVRAAALTAVAVVGALLGAGPTATAASTVAVAAGADAEGIRTLEERVEVAAGPGEPGTIELDTTLYLPESTPAPAVLVAHGFGGTKASVDAEARELAGRGFVVQAWSARGFGASGGRIALVSPDHEVADARALVDRLAARPDVVLDAPGDPRVGVTGGSYGGALSLMLAGYDRRIDALAPVITWNDLAQALFPNAASAPGTLPTDTPARGAGAPDGVFKRGWAGVFFSAGLAPGGGPGGAVEGVLQGATGGAAPAGDAADDATGGSDGDPAASRDGAVPPADDGSAAPAAAGPAPAVPGATDPATPATCGRFTPEVCSAYTEAATTGRLSPATAELLRRSSPVTVTDRITAPTLVVQGAADTLFGLDQADATARQVAAAGAPVRVLWYGGGHDGARPDQGVRDAVGVWFDHWLAGRGGPDGDPGRSFGYTVASGVRTESDTPTSRTVVAPAYPGLAGAPAVATTSLPLEGEAQVALVPAGGNPAAITSLPGLGGLLGNAGSRVAAFTAELPGQSARFRTPPVEAPLLVAGAPRVDLAVSRVPGQPAPAEAVLFGKLYEVAPDGTRSLIGGAVAPFRVPVPADGTPARVTVTLPGVVAPVEAGNRLLVSIGTTDQGYLGTTETGVWSIGPGGAAAVAVPVVPGEAVTANTVPRGPLLGIAGVLGAALLAWVVALVRRRRRPSAAPGPSDPGPSDPGPSDRGPSGPRALAAVAPGAGGPAGVDGPSDPRPLEVRDLAKTYRGGFTAVRGVSFDVERGMVLGLLGPNGAGKTTVLRMLMGLIRPTAGSIHAFGQQVGPGAPVLSRIGAFVEGPGFLPHLSGLDNLRLYWASTGRPAEEAHLDDALEIAGLGGSVRRRVGAYSQGMRQRLAIAQAMLGLPELLVLDEPTNGLDPPQIHAMREVLQRYAAAGRTVLVSSHLLAEVEQTCTHVVVMHQGTVVAGGTVDDIIAGGGAATFTVDTPARAAAVLGGLDGVAEVAVDGDAVHADLNGTPRAEAVRALVTSGVQVHAAGPRRRLEDAFLQLVGEDVR